MDRRIRRLEMWAVLGHAAMCVMHLLARKWHRERWGRYGGYGVLHGVLAIFSGASIVTHARRLRNSHTERQMR